MNRPDVDMRIREGGEPAAEERCAGLRSTAAYPAWRPEDDIRGKHFRESVDVVGVERCRPSFEGFAGGHRHGMLLWIADFKPKGRPGDDPSLGGRHPGFFSFK